MIRTEKEYKEALVNIDVLMKKGEENFTEKEFVLLSEMAKEIEAYEENYITLPAPKTIAEMVALKLFERHMSQSEFAKRAGLGIPKVNQILKGKRNVDVAFLKAVHSFLDIPADFLLSRV